MGATHVTVRITNPADPDRFWEGLFLVDTGATDSLVPRSASSKLSTSKPEGQARVRTGRWQRDFCHRHHHVAKIEFMGEICWWDGHHGGGSRRGAAAWA